MDVALNLSQRHLSVSLIIPARNEARNLPHVLPHIPAFVDDVILVDGHSTDDTIAVAQSLLPNIRILEQDGKGKGDAIRLGLAAAKGDMIVLLDADGSADPLEIPLFVSVLLEGNDFAKGSRFLKGGGSHDITFLRSSGNFALTLLVNILFHARFTDLCYGYNAFWRHCTPYVEIRSGGFEIETLLNIQLHVAGLKIQEVPSMEYPRIHGLSNLNAFRDGWRILKLILHERQHKKQRSALQLVQRQSAPIVQHQAVPEEAAL